MSDQYLPADRFCSWDIYLNGARVGNYKPRFALTSFDLELGSTQLGTPRWDGRIYVERSQAFPEPIYIRSFAVARLTLQCEDSNYTFQRDTIDCEFFRGVTEDWRKLRVKPSFYPMTELDLAHNHLYNGTSCRCSQLKFNCPTLSLASEKAATSFQQ